MCTNFCGFFGEAGFSEWTHDIEFVKETSPNVWWYDGERIVFRSDSTAKLLRAMKEDSDITLEQLSAEAGISVAAVKKQLRQMTRKGYIQRRESGAWHVFATTSV